MIAFEDQLEGFTLTKHLLSAGEVIAKAHELALIERWEGIEAIRARRGSIRLCVEKLEFERRTVGLEQ